MPVSRAARWETSKKPHDYRWKTVSWLITGTFTEMFLLMCAVPSNQINQRKKKKRVLNCHKWAGKCSTPLITTCSSSRWWVAARPSRVWNLQSRIGWEETHMVTHVCITLEYCRELHFIRSLAPGSVVLWLSWTWHTDKAHIYLHIYLYLYM